MRRATGLRGPAQRLGPACCLLLGVGSMVLTGCHHRRPQPVLLPAQTPVPLEPVPSPTDSTQIEPSKPKLPPVPVASGAMKPSKAKKKSKTTVAGAAPAGAKVQGGDPPPAASAPEPVAIGSLTVAGDQSPKAQQEAADLIAGNERRLGSLTPEALRSQAALVSKVRTFQRDAQQALGSGDAAGSQTLATKAKLLLDDLEQGNATK